MNTPRPQSIDITVAQFEAYLRHKQWQIDGDIRKVAMIWHREDDEAAEVILPLPTARDFHQRLRDAIQTLAKYENREQFELLGSIKGLFANVVSIRVAHADTKNGTIPIGDGVLLISKARELLSAAAQSVFAKRKHYIGKAPAEANAYLDTLLLGQTEIGSYVVNVIAPMQENADQMLSMVEAVSLTQAVSLSLLASLDALVTANNIYKKKGDLAVFDEAVLSGVSANMCDALLGFSGIKNDRNFEVTITTAPSAILDMESRKFDFDADQVELLKTASSYYKEDYVLSSQKLTGYIVKLSRPKNESAGTITVEAIVSGVERKVRMDLTGDDYHMAVLAHDGGKLVRVEGNVWIKTKSAELLSPVNFGIIENSDLF